MRVSTDLTPEQIKEFEDYIMWRLVASTAWLSAWSAALVMDFGHALSDTKQKMAAMCWEM